MSAAAVVIDRTRPNIPFGRLVQVELRKMFNTRSGFWLMVSIAIISVLATIGVIAFASDEFITYQSFGGAIGFPLSVLLPVMAILLVTSEWTQRAGLTTFTLAPHRGTVIGAKAVAAIIAGLVSALIAFAIGAVGNVVGAALNGLDVVWDVSFRQFVLIIFANVLGLLIGFMFGTLIRSSAGAIVAYFAYSFLIPTIFGILAAFQEWFRDIQPWIDFGSAQAVLFEDTPSGEQWAQLGVSGLIWFVIPMVFGIWSILRSEVK